MSDQIFEEQRQAEEDLVDKQWGGKSDLGPAGLGLLLFILGIGVGFPLAIVSNEFLTTNADIIVTVVVTALFLLSVVGATLLLLRRHILSYLFDVTSAKLEQFSRPLADTARHIVDRQPDAAVESAEKLTKLAFARWAWISTRRWLIASLTGLLAAMAALAGTALLFRQNELLAVQTVRLEEQNSLLVTQIELSEAQRTASILPGMLEIGAQISVETERLKKDGRGAAVFELTELSEGLRARIIAATLAARPYRYLQGAAVDPRDTEGLIRAALSRRPEILTRPLMEANAQGDPSSTLIERRSSPERGMIVSLLYAAGIYQTELLNFYGADFSFAEIKTPTLNLMTFTFARLRFADFSRVHINSVSFGAASLEHAWFRDGVLKNCDFSGIPSDKVALPYKGDPSLPVMATNLAGADFSRSVVVGSGFSSVNGLAMIFDTALLSEPSFKNASIGGSTFRNTILVAPDFTGAMMKGVDLSGAIVFDERFLEKTAEVAMPETFIKDRYQLEPIDRAEVQKHPLAHQLFAVPTALIAEKQAFRVKRIKDFK